MTLIFIFGVGTYFLLMALIGYLASRKVKTMEDYLIAGRRLPFTSLVVSSQKLKMVVGLSEQ